MYAPAQMKCLRNKQLKNEALPCNENGPACMFIYKTLSEPHVGELSFFKVYSGCIKAGMELENESTNSTEKINQLFLVEGNKRIAVNELCAGDIGATLKLKNTHVNNTLHAKGKNYALKPIQFPSPNITVAVEATTKGEEEKIVAGSPSTKRRRPNIGYRIFT